MSRLNYVFTSESVSEGHPDKVCDRISDAVLDAFLSEEPNARVACETFATTNTVVVGGKLKRVRYQYGYTSDWKKAVVTLKAGQKIEVI